MINILHISTATSWRGGEQQLSYLIDALKRYPVKQYLLCVEQSEISKRIINNCEIITLKEPSLLSFNWVRKISEISIKKNIDIIQLQV